MDIRRYKRRYWAVYSPSDELICVCVYKKGAKNVVRLLEEKPSPARICRPPQCRTKRVSASVLRKRAATSRRTLHAPPFSKRPSLPKQEEGNHS